MIYSILSDFLRNACKCLNPVLCIMGLIVTIWVARVAGRKGYLVIGAYFLLSLYVLSAAPYVNRMIAARRAPDLSEETQRRIDVAVREAADRVREEAGHPALHMRLYIRYRLDLVLLVIGVWLLGAQDLTAARQDLGESARRMCAVALAVLSLGFVCTAYRAFSHYSYPMGSRLTTRWIVPPLAVALAVVLGVVSAKLFKSRYPSNAQPSEPVVGQVSSDGAPSDDLST